MKNVPPYITNYFRADNSMTEKEELTILQKNSDEPKSNFMKSMNKG